MQVIFWVAFGYHSAPESAVRRGATWGVNEGGIVTMAQDKKPGAEKRKTTIVINERLKIPDDEGNGQLRILVTQYDDGTVCSYSYAYINRSICSEDNGRVLGYDNKHGQDHKHFMGNITPVKFVSLKQISDLFKAEWTKYRTMRKAE
ncbi:toxin-antitoxin system TumE family protein [Pseudomonas sp. GM48]|uniref:toxin-antitoxin system TumE family protein n=1 Tax=Pseudomonas sp. GM48 TaxID=1144330 RepID=UPI001EE682BA|nr:DUF6516 family protein [Pseudomonas sp. GM48]